MRPVLLAVALALNATPLAAQRVVSFRGGVSVSGEDPLGFADATFASGFYLDIPQEGEVVEGTIHLGVRAFRVGLLWIRHDESPLDIPAMILFGEPVFLAVGGAPGIADLSLAFKLIAGVGFTASVPGWPGISWGAEALYMHEVTGRQPSGLSGSQVVYTAGIGIHR